MPLPPRLRICFFLTLFLASVLRAQERSPEASLARARPGDGLEVRLVAAEPLIRQPVSISFDPSGRMWVLEYLQYPNPAGLKRVAQDQFLRTKWDQVPPPPPRGPRGADKLTILSNPNGKGRYQSAKTFVDGLNLATGFALGQGGVFILQAPYLLFYPDKDNDDRPDAPPEVLLSGFGMEDSHAHANSLQWGPDGWLYGAQGSTVTARIRGIEFQQGIWRYHPVTKQFELFSEGGGNTWGLDFDKDGEIISGTNFGDVACLHQRQGAYHIKGFAKHGPLHNPHTYGYFDHIPYKGFQGGHVTCGGIVYQGGALGEKRENQYIAGNLLSSVVNWHELSPNGSSFTATHGGMALNPRDTWFRPIDLLVGPDAGVYVVDWYDKRATHLDPLDNWDKTNGRVYRLHAPGFQTIQPFDLSKESNTELVLRLSHPNVWMRREARRLLGERKASHQSATLRKMVREGLPQTALEALWALHGTGGLDEAFSLECLVSRHPSVRMWAMRLACDDHTISREMLGRLTTLLKSDPSAMVRAQAACSAKRLPPVDNLAILGSLISHDEDLDDPQIPLLLWWALEESAGKDPLQTAEWASQPAIWNQSIFTRHLAERLARRLIADNIPAENQALAVLWKSAPASGRSLLATGIAKGLAGTAHHRTPPELATVVDDLMQAPRANPQFLEISARLGSAVAKNKAQADCSSQQTPAARRIQLLGLLAQTSPAWTRENLLPLVLNQMEPVAVRRAATELLAGLPESDWAPKLLENLATLPPEITGPGRRLLLSRASTARAFLSKLDALPQTGAAPSREEAQALMELKDPQVTAWVEKKYGKLASVSGEKQARISYIDLMVGRLPPGDPKRGKELFTKQQCASCHTLFGEGIKLGPDLTTADRGSRRALITHIVEPSGAIRPEFQAQVVETTDGKFFTGLIVENTPDSITLADVKNFRTKIPRSQVESITPANNSLMPEKLLDGLTDEQLADFFAYLMATKKPG